ncbi:DUF4365 domain-containing protein [Vibrio parahaemolyticus]|uniref:DUF4365 domain-containing protein n=1 Tax=Vibrio parahaemolyticus TaxID=670 RepID=UPI00041F209F|nr:DUF4365 domain-containing protein [Vibrio parahaemolyticus]
MRFDTKSSNGKAGEHYFAYWICGNFGWPCRLLDIDIGIDAQLEIFDNKKHSMGEFIGVQIKASQNYKRKITVSICNLEYWKNITDPVIVVAISDIKGSPEIYWKLMTNDFIDSLVDKVNKREAKKVTKLDKNKLEISFTLSKNSKLSIDDMETFRLLPYHKKLLSYEEHFQKAEKEYNELAVNMWDGTDKVYRIGNLTRKVHLDTVDFYMDKFHRYFLAVDQIKAVLNNAPQLKNEILKSKELAKYTSFLNVKLGEYIYFIHRMDSDYGHRFYKKWTKSDKHTAISSVFEEEYKEGKS